MNEVTVGFPPLSAIGQVSIGSVPNLLQVMRLLRRDAASVFCLALVQQKDQTPGRGWRGRLHGNGLQFVFVYSADVLLGRDCGYLLLAPAPPDAHCSLGFPRPVSCLRSRNEGACLVSNRRVHLVAGSTGWHRANLIDVFFKHFGDWWLLGTDKQATWGFGNLDDLCEQWIGEGETGGLATLLCFILLITRSFSRIGKASKRIAQDRKQEWLLWLIGVALFSHCVGYFGIELFRPDKILWLALLCIISTATTPRIAAARLPSRKEIQALPDTEDEATVPGPR